MASATIDPISKSTTGCNDKVRRARASSRILRAADADAGCHRSGSPPANFGRPDSNVQVVESV